MTEPFNKTPIMIQSSLQNPMINFNNTISGGWNQATPKIKAPPSIPQKLHRQNSQQTQPAGNNGTVGNFVNFAQTNTRFFSDLNIPKIPTRVFPNPSIQIDKNQSDPTNKNNEINNNSQTFSQPNRSNFERKQQQHISATNYTTSTEALYENENNSKSHKQKEDYILNSFQKNNSLPAHTKEELPNNNVNDTRDSTMNHKKKKLEEAKKQAEFFDDNKIKQFRFAQADEEEEFNFRELCNAFQTLN